MIVLVVIENPVPSCLSLIISYSFYQAYSALAELLGYLLLVMSHLNHD